MGEKEEKIIIFGWFSKKLKNVLKNIYKHGNQK
jgi:hypothetical protein